MKISQIIKRRLVNKQITFDIEAVTKRSAVNVTDFILYAYLTKNIVQNKEEKPLVKINGVYAFDPSPSDELSKLLRNPEYLNNKKAAIEQGLVVSCHKAVTQSLHNIAKTNSLPDSAIDEIVFHIYGYHFLLPESDVEYLSERAQTKYETAAVKEYKFAKEGSESVFLDIEQDDEKSVEQLITEAKAKEIEKFNKSFWVRYLFKVMI